MDIKKLLKYYIFCLTITVSWSTKTNYFHEQSVVTLKPTRELVKDAYFGYSITYVASNKRLIVSAPNSDNVGKIFQCVLDNATCSEIHSDHKETRSKETEDIGFWNGASMAAGKSFFVACAPRLLSWYNKTIEKGVEIDAWLTSGQCSTYNDTNNFLPTPLHKIKPYDLTRGVIYYKDEANSFAWSISVTDDDSIILGAPAVISGRVAIYRNHFEFPVLDVGSFRGVKYNYGYSVILQNRKKNQLEYIVSSPYGSHGIGKINVRNDIRKKTSIYGKVVTTNDDGIGAMYGAAICLMRQGNNDYLLVGSPAYAEKKTRNFDQGKVDIYADYNTLKKKKYLTIYGTKIGGYFGHAIVNLGDLNGDHKDDVAVSAPYEDDYRGAIYIYSGASLLDRKNSWLQRIQPQGHRFFGLSMVALNNYDDNGCSALGVGAPGNNRALVFHCLASVDVQLDVSPRNNELNISSRTSLTPSHDSNMKQFTFYSCVYIKYPRKPAKIKLDLQFEVMARHPEVDVLNSWKYSLSFSEKKPTYCTALTLNLTKNLDYSLPLETRIEAVHLNSPLRQEAYDPSLVMLSDRSALTKLDTLHITHCKENCTPDLEVSVTTSFRDEYIIGATGEEQVSISVRNTGGPAYKASVTVQVTGVRVKLAPECERVGSSETWRCPSKGPVWTNNVWKIKDIYLEMNTLTSANKLIKIVTNVLDSYEEKKTSKNTTLQFALGADKRGVVVKGFSNFNEVLNVTDGTETRVEHTYLIINNGITNWVYLEYELQLPKKYIATSPDVRNLVLVDEETTCALNDDFNTSVVVTCFIPSLKRNQTIKIVALIDVKVILTDNLTDTFNTNFTLKLDDTIITESLSNTVKFLKVPVYVIVFAVIFSVSLLAVVAFSFYKFGFLKRKNKEKLIKLQKEVRRRTMIRQSLVASTGGENASMEQIAQEIEFIENIAESKRE